MACLTCVSGINCHLSINKHGGTGSMSSGNTFYHYLLFVALCGASSIVSAQEAIEIPPELKAKVQSAARTCAGFENGDFAMEAGAIVRTDLDGDLKADWVLNEQYFTCSSAASLYGSTGGTMSHFLIGDQVSSLLNQGWEMRTLGRNRVLLAEVHGTQCDALGYIPCVIAAVWDSEANKWRSASAHWEE